VYKLIGSAYLVLRGKTGSAAAREGHRDRYVMPRDPADDLCRRRYSSACKDPGRPIEKGAVQWACRLARFRRGIAKPVMPHSLRRAVFVHLLESGTDLPTIQLLGVSFL
jgi:hypothetical protein